MLILFQIIQRNNVNLNLTPWEILHTLHTYVHLYVLILFFEIECFSYRQILFISRTQMVSTKLLV